MNLPQLEDELIENEISENNNQIPVIVVMSKTPIEVLNEEPPKSQSFFETDHLKEIINAVASNFEQNLADPSFKISVPYR